MNKHNYELWTEFRGIQSNQLEKADRELIVQIYAEEFFQRIKADCGCSGKLWQKRINAINNLYESV